MQQKFIEGKAYYVFCGRLKDLVNRRGEKINCAEVEMAVAMLSQPALAQVDKATDAGNAKARELVTYFVGQGVGLIDGIRSARSVVQDFKEQFAQAVEGLVRTTEE